MFKADLHIHTHYSNDSLIKPEELVKTAKKIGLKAIAITDHDTIKGALRISMEYSDKELIIIPGIEITTEFGHLLAFNLTEKPKKKMSLEALIEDIHREGGIVAPAHPFDYFRRFRFVEENIHLMDAIEAANSSNLRLNTDIKKALEYSEKYNIGYTAGSDAHIINAVGNAYLYSNDYLSGIDDIIEYILKKRFKIFARRTPWTVRMMKILKKL